jgi:NAD(P)-dependent dehydrogenase (short-subunit alcohol dehydrogenase family)
MKRKTAIITGAASGIGKSTAILFAQNDINVVLADIDEFKLEEVCKSITHSGYKASFLKVDVTKPEDMKALVDSAVKTYGKLDIAVNNAGISGEVKPIVDQSIDTWLKVINVNLNSVFYGMKYQIEAMLNGGGGSIINVSSILGKVGFAGSSAYAAAKHGLIGLTETAALEYSSKNVRVNSVGPGFIDTPMLSVLDETLKSQISSLHPIGRMGKPEEIAELIYWLGSDKSSFVTGSYYPIDGGYLAK